MPQRTNKIFDQFQPLKLVGLLSKYVRYSTRFKFLRSPREPTRKQGFVSYSVLETLSNFFPHSLLLFRFHHVKFCPFERCWKTFTFQQALKCQIQNIVTFLLVSRSYLSESLPATRHYAIPRNNSYKKILIAASCLEPVQMYDRHLPISYQWNVKSIPLWCSFS